MSMKLAVEKKVTFHLILFAFKYVYQLRVLYHAVEYDKN